MIAYHRLSQDRPSFLCAIKPNRLIGVILAAALVATGLAAFDTAQTHHAIAAHTEASDSTAPATNAGRSGAMLVYEPVW
ncbi:MAG: hypothetical protein ACJ8DY_20615 [Xanthobacteraceae bacterium]